MKKWKYSKDPSSQELKIPFWKNKKSILILGIGIILLMIGSVLTFFTNPDTENQLNYNGHNFFLSSTGWTTMIGNQQVSFEQSPQDLENIPIESFHLPDKKIYLAFNPEETTENSYEIQRLRSFLFFTGITTNPACIQEKGCSDLPLVHCTDTNTLLYLHYGNESKISTQDNCIILETENSNPSKTINRFIYKILGIMP